MKTNTVTLPTFAKNKSEFFDKLFTGPRTFDGFIERVSANEIHFAFRSHSLAFNRHGVVCTKIKVNGRTWFSFTPSDVWPFSMSETDAIFRAIFLPLFSR